MKQIDSDDLKARLYIAYAKNIEKWCGEREKHTDGLLKQGAFEEAVEIEKRQTASRVMVCALALIDDAETVGSSIEPVKGKWIDMGDDYVLRWKCSECKNRYHYITNYCPDCGAYMRAEDGEWA